MHLCYCRCLRKIQSWTVRGAHVDNRCLEIPTKLVVMRSGEASYKIILSWCKTSWCDTTVQVIRSTKWIGPLSTLWKELAAFQWRICARLVISYKLANETPMLLPQSLQRGQLRRLFWLVKPKEPGHLASWSWKSWFIQPRWVLGASICKVVVSMND